MSTVSTNFGQNTFYAITHLTKIENLESILKSGYLYSYYDRFKNRILSKGVFSSDDQLENLDKFFSNVDQFPGVYCSLIYNQKPLPIESGTVMLVFPINLLYQKNYHINLIDQNGFINEDSYNSESLDKLPDFNKVEKFYKDYPGNEIVFSDSIPLTLLNSLICLKKDISKVKNIVNKVQFKPTISRDDFISTNNVIKTPIFSDVYFQYIDKEKTPKHLYYAKEIFVESDEDLKYQHLRYNTKEKMTPISFYQNLLYNHGIFEKVSNYKEYNDVVKNNIIELWVQFPENRLETIRKDLLGDVLFHKCETDVGVEKVELQKRLNILKETNRIEQDATIEDIVKLCELKSKPSLLIYKSSKYR